MSPTCSRASTSDARSAAAAATALTMTTLVVDDASSADDDASTTDAAAALTLKLLVDTKAGRVLYAEAGTDAVDFIASILTRPPAAVAKLLGKDAMPGSLGSIYGSFLELGDTFFRSAGAKQALLSPDTGEGGFVREGAAVVYMVMDDLRVAPLVSAIPYAKLVTDNAALQEKTVRLGRHEGLEILRLAPQSKTVLTDVFLAPADADDAAPAPAGGGEKKRKAA